LGVRGQGGPGIGVLDGFPPEADHLSRMIKHGSQKTPLRAEPSPTILVVEDEDALRTAICRLLQEEGYDVLEAQTGAAALQLLKGTGANRIGLVLTDLRMPVMDGREFAAGLARVRPSLPIVFMSGYTAQLMDMRLVSPHLSFLAKPFRNDDLLATVRGQLQRRE
jgi:two-component system cell cycle sensor histidine kinase/response regulator CckA